MSLKNSFLFAVNRVISILITLYIQLRQCDQLYPRCSQTYIDKHGEIGGKRRIVDDNLYEGVRAIVQLTNIKRLFKWRGEKPEYPGK